MKPKSPVGESLTMSSIEVALRKMQEEMLSNSWSGIDKAAYGSGGGSASITATEISWAEGLKWGMGTPVCSHHKPKNRQEDMDKNLLHKLLNIIAFCSLMEGNGGIMDKSPTYILEKFQRYIQQEESTLDWANEDNWKQGLDAHNREKIKIWVEKWLTEQQKRLLRPSTRTDEGERRRNKEISDRLWQEAISAYEKYTPTDRKTIVKNEKGGEEDDNPF